MAKKKKIEKKFVIKKRFPTSKGIYEIGDIYTEKDERVTEFLKQQKII